MEKCIIIHRVIILKGSGEMIKNKVKGRWIGLILDKSMLANGKIIINKDGVCIFGLNQKAKESILETDIKVIGWMV